MKYALRLFSLFTILTVSFLFFTNRAQAATLNVVAGTDGTDANGQCQLSEAIQNINDQATTNADCSAGDGNNDTINLPAGTMTLSADLPTIQQSVAIQGQGMDETIIDANLNRGITAEAGTLKVFDIRIIQFQRAAIRADGTSNLVVERAEIANSSSPELQTIDGINFSDPPQNTPASRSVLVKDVYIQNLTSTGGATMGIFIASTNNAVTTATIENVAIKSLSGTGANTVVNGVGLTTFQGIPSAGTLNATVSNITVQDISSTNEFAAGLNAFATTATGNSQVNVVASNITVSDLIGAPSQVWGGVSGGAIVGGGLALQSGDVAAVDIEVSNSLSVSGEVEGCIMKDVTQLFGGAGESNLSISSLGGNISDDASCNDYFTQPTDQTEVSGLASTLGPLTDNGGLVPTIPLFPGSPAIDAGVAVPGLTTDARGVSRPQCAAFDSGAYEYSGTCPVPQQLTYPDSEKGTTVSLILPDDVTSPSVSAVDPDTIPKDGENQFPAGLTSFQFTTTPGATKTVTLYYDLPGNPSDYTARKYKTSTQTFIDVPNASITREDYSGKSMLKLTYSITDGGILDQDGVANGTVIDPVGLATTSLADTGESTWVYLVGVMTLIGGGLFFSTRVLFASGNLNSKRLS